MSSKKKKFTEERQARAQHIQPKGPRQDRYIRSMEKNILTVATGHAGCGKTFCAASVAANELLKGNIDRIVLVRPYVGMGDTAGLLPGDIYDKLEPYLKPMLEVLEKRLGFNDFKARYKKTIELCAVEHMRGRSFEDAFIIIDETQNTTPAEIRSIVTRIGEGCRMVFCGDPKQTDIRKANGLDYIVKVLNDNKVADTDVISFTEDDIVRSGICKTFVKIFEKEGPLRV